MPRSVLTISNPVTLFLEILSGGVTGMSENKNSKKPVVDNIISDHTGAHDLRFILWRDFCSQNNIPVESLPSQLDDEQREKWEEVKSTRLRGR